MVLSSQAQNTEKISQIPDSTLVTAPEAIPIISVVQNIEKTEAELKIIERKLDPKNIHVLDSLFPAYAEFIKKEKRYTTNFMSANPNRQKIENLYNKWDGYKLHLKNWENEINDYESRNFRLLETIDQESQVWVLTYQNALDKKAPKEVLNSISNVNKRIEDLKKSIEKENNLALKIESKISLEIESASEVMDEILALKNSETYNLFYLRHKPIWKISFKSKNSLTSSEKSESIKTNINETLNYIYSNESSFYLYFAIVLILTGIVIFLKKGFDNYEFKDEDTNLQISKDIIQKYTTASIVFLSLFLATIFFKSTPRLFENILILLLIIAASSVAVTQTHKNFKRIFHFIILFYILDSIKTYVWFHSGYYRVYLLIESILVITTVFYHLKHRQFKIGPTKFNKLGYFLIKIAPIIYVFAIVAIISNVLGYTNLTDITLRICTQIGVITTVFYSLLLIIEGISTSLIHRHFSVKSEIDYLRKTTLEIKLLKIIRITLFILWLLFFLSMIDVLRPFNEYLTDIISEPYKLGSITFTLGAILSFISILVVSFLLTSLIAFHIDDSEGVLRYLRLPKGVSAAISLVVRYLIIASGFVFALSSLGLDLSKFNLLAGALGIGIGFGLQTIISNFVSGLILVFERPILKGDTIEFNDLIGTVNKIGVRSSKIKTFDGAEIIVPNNNLMSNNLINWTLSDSRKRIEILIGTSYDSDPNHVLEILKKAAESVEDVLKVPEPQALFRDFGDSSLNFMLRFWVPYEIGLKVKSDVSIAIYNFFKQEGIEIPFPQQDLYIKELPENKQINKINK